jgi:hypothetical protein
MGKRIYPLSRLKYWWAYDIEEICELYKEYKLHPQTVRHWIKNGLLIIKGTPALIYGNELIKFLGKMNKASKCQTEFHHMFCMKCKEDKTPYKKQVELSQFNGFIKAKAQCQNCKSIMYKSYKLNDFQKVKLNFHKVDVLELYDSKDSTLKTHFAALENIPPNEPAQMELF